MDAIYTLDLNFLNIQGAIASYLIPHTHGAAIVETGPGTTVEGLIAGLKAHGYTPQDVTDVLLTHIHLDHAGAAGWMSRQGAKIHVHPNGAPHLVNPEKLLASAGRIYGDMMEMLWGEFIPVPEESISVPADGEMIEIGGRCFQAVDTPGHAEHHYAYLIDGVLFSGDIGGVRLGGSQYLRLPMPPPEFNPVRWRESVKKLAKLPIERMAPTHFGVYSDPDWHLAKILKELDEVEAWMEREMPGHPGGEELRKDFTAWTDERFKVERLDPELLAKQQAVNPPFMSADGIARWWRKTYRGSQQ